MMLMLNAFRSRPNALHSRPGGLTIAILRGLVEEHIQSLTRVLIAWWHHALLRGRRMVQPQTVQRYYGPTSKIQWLSLTPSLQDQKRPNMRYQDSATKAFIDFVDFTQVACIDFVDVAWHFLLLRRPAPSGRPAQRFARRRRSCANSCLASTINMEYCEYDKYCLLLRRPAPPGRTAQPSLWLVDGSCTPNYCWKTFLQGHRHSNADCVA